MTALRYIMIGGFLGAGKTTTLGRLARHYMDQGRTVGIVTNDQAQDLVDTHTLRSQGFSVEEVAGACFCCQFDELLDRINELDEQNRPEIILAEPVGSCTDLVATVVQPLKDLYGDRFSIAPYCAIFKPGHGLRILGGKRGGFSPKAEYIFRKQLEEADMILINRIDEFEEDQLTELTGLIEQHYPGVPVMRISAKHGDGFEALTAVLDQDGDFGRKVLDIDYDTYAEGEAELGWLNSSARVVAESEFDLDAFLVDVISHLRASLAEADGETAHLKAIGLWEGFFGVANLVSSADNVELSLPSHCQVKEVDVIVNARVALDPDQLRELAHQAVREACASRQATADFRKAQSFRPARPVPTHRYDAAK